MLSFISKLRRRSKDEAIDHIFSTRKQQGWCVVNYLYGANITARNIFKKNKSDREKKYVAALAYSDIILPDGIAFQLFFFFYFRAFLKEKIRLPNLNGTDFLPALLEHLQKHTHLSLVLYGTTPEGIERSSQFLKQQGYHVVYWQDGYRKFDWDAFTGKRNEVLGKRDGKKIEKEQLFVFIQGRTSVTDPMQEIRTLEHLQKIKENKFLVCNQSGTFDHSVLGGKEQRAPKWVQKIKCERLRRTICNPKKQRKKIIATLALLPLFITVIIFPRLGIQKYAHYENQCGKKSL